MKKGIGAKICAVVMCSLMVILGGCGSTQTEEVQQNMTVFVETAKPRVGELVLQNRFVGSVSPAEQVMVIPLVSGEITETFFEVGDMVQEGDVLFTIDDEVAKLQVKQAQVGVQNARLNKENAEITKNNAALGVDSTIKSAQSQLNTQQELTQKQQQAQLDQLQQQLDSLYLQKDTTNLQLEALYKSWSDLDKYNQPTYEVENQVAQVKKSIEGLNLQIEALKKTIQDTNESYYTQNTEVYEQTRQQLANQIVSSQYQEQQAGVAVEVAQENIRNAQQSMDSAKLQLSYYTVTAPISGMIDAKNVTEHGFASSGNAAYIISDKESMQVTFHVSEDIRNTLYLGEDIIIERNGRQYGAKITEIAVAVGTQTGLFQIKAKVDADGNELPGGVSVTIIADTYRAQDSLLVPYSAIYYENGQSYLYVMKEGVAVKTYVQTGIFDEETIVITGGVTKEDDCIVSWSPQLADGVEVYTN